MDSALQGPTPVQQATALILSSIGEAARMRRGKTLDVPDFASTRLLVRVLTRVLEQVLENIVVGDRAQTAAEIALQSWIWGWRLSRPQ